MKLAALAVACLAVVQPLWSVASGSTLDCAPASWLPEGQLDASRLIQGAQREAVAGDPAAQWLLGALYLTGQGVPQDRSISLRWLETAARSVGPAQRKGSGQYAMSDIEMYDVMRNVAERALPPLIQGYGQKEGIALFYLQVRSIVQGLSGCLDRGH